VSSKRLKRLRRRTVFFMDKHLWIVAKLDSSLECGQTRRVLIEIKKIIR
jgi:hypothetical protein